jgi:acetyltransferase-like isoleucine patch superfamily enzyme
MGPPLFHTGLDMTYWMYRILHLQDLLMNNHARAVIFDLLVVVSGLLVICFPLRRRWIILFSILIFVYAISFNSVALIHTVTVNGLIVVFLPFWIGDEGKFGLAWQGIRYYACFIYFAAFIWKAFIGNSFFYWEQGDGSFRLNLVEYLYHNPGTGLSDIYRWFIRNPWMLNAGHVFTVLLEGIMVTGFFTRKFDRILFWIPVLICVITYFFADVLIFELLVLNFAFIGPGGLDRIGRFPKRTVQKIFRLRTDTGLDFYLAHFFFKYILRQHANIPWAIQHSSTVHFPERISRGREVYPGDSPGNFIDARNGIGIGDFTNIGPNVGILSANHDLIDNGRFPAAGPIRIGAFCWIGMGAIILPEVELGDFTIVGAGAVVTSSFKDGYVVIAGNPARVIKQIDKTACEQFKRSKYAG